MKKSRSPKSASFPFRFEKNGRTGTIYRLGNGTFKSYFRFAGAPRANTHKTFEAAFEYLEREFTTLDTNRENSLSLNPLNSDVRTYAELEQLLREKGGGATLREAVAFFLAHQGTKRFRPLTVAECSDKFLAEQKAANVTPIHVKTLAKHFRRFRDAFGGRKIHELSALEISEWLNSRKDERTGALWSAKTRASNLGSIVSLSLFARDTLNAIPDVRETEPQKVKRPLKDERGEVDIYTPDELRCLLFTAIEHDVDMIPCVAAGAFQGLRPAEFHAEGTRRRPLRWEAFIWADRILHITGQKVRSKANRDIPLHDATQAWLNPWRGKTAEIWQHTHAHTKKMLALREAAGVRSIYDGLRHSYASYRIRQLRGNLPELAQEMGNSPREIINSYKRNVTDAQAEAWFALRPPTDYGDKIKAALALRKSL